MSARSRPDQRTARSHALSPDERFSRCLTALRRAWKRGPEGRSEVDRALHLLRELGPAAASTHELQSMIEQSIQQLDHVGRERDPDAFRAGIQQIGERLNALKPHLALASEPAELGKLNSALGERRAGRIPTTQSQRDVTVTPQPPDALVDVLPYVGPKRKSQLEKLGIVTIEDLLRHAPRRFIDYTNPTPLNSPFGLQGEITVRGEIRSMQVQRGKPDRTTVLLNDGTGELRIVFFSNYITRQLAIGDEIFVHGTLSRFGGRPEMTSPEWELVTTTEPQLIPVYPSTSGLHQKGLRNLTRTALDATENRLVDWMLDAQPYMDERWWERMPDVAQAYRHLHYPDEMAQFETARKRLLFENLLLLQIGLIKRKRERKTVSSRALTIELDLIKQFEATLPFTLTGAQQRAIQEVSADMGRPEPMARLLQGDVGSGKTAVAATMAYVARGNRMQTAIMAPTEVLAEQHERSLADLFSGLPEDDRPSVAMLTGSTRAKARREITAATAAGEVDILVGTHALIQDDVEFQNLGFVVIDEQHRFGVRQRGELAGKAGDTAPHMLSMTATPIPRTLSMVLHGDLDVSVIDERPPGRIPIETRRYGPNDREAAYTLVREQVALGHQAFVICPLVEESEAVEARAAVAEAKRLQEEVFPDLHVQVLHGRMSAKAKDEVMTGFRERQFEILVSTSVIEVGIDIPNATVMMIEGADRFGLSQLHQFRGRVGRGGAKSYCLLLADANSFNGDQRLQVMVDSDDGFILAEHDLEMRGPGDFVGTRQSGLPELGWLEQGLDTRLLDAAHEIAEKIVAADPDIGLAQFPRLRLRLNRFWESAGPIDSGRS